ncbi:MAG TPA: hypothetical protein VKE53_09815 [Pseudolabrys sp.]|nr:hypothetical protein [Pseudolabrys sp.]
MGLLELVITVCAIADPTLCEDRHLQYAGGESLQQCAVGAPPYIAQWIGEHPKWMAVRWHCEYPGPKKV